MSQDAPDPPDYSDVAAASELAAERAFELGTAQLEWAKEQGLFNQDLLETVLMPQLAAMDEQLLQAQEDREYYEDVFRPLEVSLAQEAVDYASPERIELEAGRAQADVAQAFDTQRNQMLSQLEGFGIDPSQTRFSALDSTLRAQQAAAMAGAGNQSRTQTENVGRALRGEAINIGRGLPADISRAYGQSVAAGQTGIQGAVNTAQVGSNMMTSPAAWMQTGNQALGTWGNTLNQGYQNRLAGYSAQTGAQNDLWGGLGSLAGFAVGGPWGGALGKWMFSEEGGEVPEPGGAAIYLPGSTDSVPAALTPGEYVVPEEVVRMKGVEFFDKLVEKYIGEEPPDDPKMVPGSQIQMRKRGGYVDDTWRVGYQGGGPVQPTVLPPMGPTSREGGALSALPITYDPYAGGNAPGVGVTQGGGTAIPGTPGPAQAYQDLLARRGERPAPGSLTPSQQRLQDIIAARNARAEAARLAAEEAATVEEEAVPTGPSLPWYHGGNPWLEYAGGMGGAATGDPSMDANLGAGATNETFMQGVAHYGPAMLGMIGPMAGVTAASLVALGMTPTQAAHAIATGTMNTSGYNSPGQGGYGNPGGPPGSVGAADFGIESDPGFNDDPDQGPW